MSQSTQHYLNVGKVAVIGAGVSGVSAGIHLKRAGIDVTVFERSSRAGGVWVFDERTAKDAPFPSITPSTGDMPDLSKFVVKDHKDLKDQRCDSPQEGSTSNYWNDIATDFAPPGPCYIALHNNVSTIEMQLSCQDWKADTAEFVPHNILGDYIQDAAVANGIFPNIVFNTRIKGLSKNREKWDVRVEQLNGFVVKENTWQYDAVVVATGHYWAPNIPDLPGLSEWKRRFPSSIQHSKLYRRPDSFKGQNVLLIGAGVSSLDIAKDIGPIAGKIYQSSRSGPYDLPSHMLPDNAARVGGIESFVLDPAASLAEDGTIPGYVKLISGERICNLHRVIVATGYHTSYPFLHQFHSDNTRAQDANDEVIVTDGQQTHNLHKDIWYIPDPTLAFVGVPYHVATFSLFEFQAMAVAAVFSGQAPLPRQKEMREEYDERLARKGSGREFHSLRGDGNELDYVKNLMLIVNSKSTGYPLATGHTKSFLDSYERRKERKDILFSKERDPAFDAAILAASSC